MGNSDFSKASRIVSIIRNHGEIHKFELMRKANISQSVYEKISPFIKFHFEDIEYDRKTGSWNQIQEQPQTPLLEMKTDWESELWKNSNTAYKKLQTLFPGVVAV